MLLISAMTLTHQFTAQDVQITSEAPAYDGFFRVNNLRLKFKKFAGGWTHELSRECFDRGHAAAVLLYDEPRDKVVLIEQFRVGALADERSPWLFEIVAGMIEPNETAENVAHREAHEEAGCQIEKLVPIIQYYSSPGACTERVDLYCGYIDSEGVGGIHGLAYEGEDIRLHVVSREEAYSAMRDGHVNNAASVIALQWLQLNHDLSASYVETPIFG